MKYFPINLDIRGRKVLVVGAGKVAARKVKTLLACGADVTVVSITFSREFDTIEGVRRMKRPYRKTDLANAALVISATNSQDVNERIRRDAIEANIFVNVVDKPDLCTFTVPAVAAAGELVITVSTGGNSPALARQIRRKLEKDLLPVYRRHLKLLAEFRPIVQATPDLDAQPRTALLKAMADYTVRDIIETHGVSAGRKLLQQMLDEAIKKQAEHWRLQNPTTIAAKSATQPLENHPTGQ